MSDKSPNLIFVFADQMRARDTGCSGDPNIATPNLDRMATERVRFTNATSMIPVCTPARAALLTGRYPLYYEDEDEQSRPRVGRHNKSPNSAKHSMAKPRRFRAPAPSSALGKPRERSLGRRGALRRLGYC